VNDVQFHELSDDGRIPNSRYPLVVYPYAVPQVRASTDPAAVIEQLFQHHGWGDSWRNGVYTYHHYHGTAHEALGCYRGKANVLFGGENGITATIAAGDVVVIPAGAGHKLLDSSDDFAVVGAYPNGQQPDMNYGKPEERELALANIERVPLPEQDPVSGADGPIRRLWASKA
jgi:uncharacterized protein YjlB